MRYSCGIMVEARCNFNPKNNADFMETPIEDDRLSFYVLIHVCRLLPPDVPWLMSA